MHELSASVDVQDENLASFERGVDQANTGDGNVGPAGKQGRNKADITWMSSSTSLSPSASLVPVPRRLCLAELLFDATPRRPLLVVRPCLLWDVGRAQRCRLLVVRPCLVRDVGRTLRRCLLVV